MGKRQVKLFKENHSEKLTKNLQEFLDDDNIEILSISYTETIHKIEPLLSSKDSYNESTVYSALLIYRNNEIY